jgi:hypothetical protein
MSERLKNVRGKSFKAWGNPGTSNYFFYLLKIIEHLFQMVVVGM